MAVTIFTVKASEIKGKRCDAPYYKSQDHTYFNNYNKTLRDYIISIVNGTDSRQYVQEGIPYLKVANIKETGISKHNLQYLPYNTFFKNKLKQGDLLVTRKGTFGVATVVTDKMENMLISSEIFHIRLNDSINPYILSYYINTDVIQKELARQSIGAIMGSLTQEVLLSLPIPDIFDQEIVDIMDQAYSEKKRLEAEADELLKSIDSYVMDKLGIEQVEQTKLTEKWFTVKASEIAGKRWDPRNILIDSNIKSIYDISTLDKLITVSSGKICKYNKDKSKLPYKVYGANGVIGSFSEYNTKKDTLLIGRVGSVGSLIITAEDVWVTDNVLVVSYKNTDIHQKYLYYYLRSINLSNYAIGSNQPVISGQRLYEIKIPLPPMPIQKEIVNECEARRNTAQQNQQLAKQILSDAKQKVETMLFN